MGLTILFPWQHTGFQTSPILKVFLATLCVSFHICRCCLIYMIQQAYKYVSLSLWPRITVRAENHLHIEIKWVGTGKEWVAMATKCFIALGVFYIELLAYKFQWSALQIGQDSSIYISDVILGWVYDIISHLICIIYTFFKLEYLRN